MIGAAFCLVVVGLVVGAVRRAISRHDDELLAEEFARVLAEVGL